MKVTQYFNVEYLGKYEQMSDNVDSASSTLLAYENFEPNVAPVPNLKYNEIKFTFDDTTLSLYYEPIKERSFIPSNIFNTESAALEIYTKCLKFCSDALLMDNFSRNFVVTVQELPNEQQRIVVTLSNKERGINRADIKLKNLSLFALRNLNNITFKVFMNSNSYMLANVPSLPDEDVRINNRTETTTNNDNNNENTIVFDYNDRQEEDDEAQESEEDQEEEEPVNVNETDADAGAGGSGGGGGRTRNIADVAAGGSGVRRNIADDVSMVSVRTNRTNSSANTLVREMSRTRIN